MVINIKPKLKIRTHTKDEEVQAFVGQVFIDQNFLLFLTAAS